MYIEARKKFESGHFWESVVLPQNKQIFSYSLMGPVINYSELLQDHILLVRCSLDFHLSYVKHTRGMSWLLHSKVT